MPENSFVIATGAELAAGTVRDKNGPWLARALGALGFPAKGLLCVGDDVTDVIAGLELAVSSDCQAVFVTGGLGPTEDDVTRRAIADFARTPLRSDPGLEKKILAFLAARGRTRSGGDLRQALLPGGAVPIANPAGTADGFMLDCRGMRVVALPGPPHELEATAGADLKALAACLPSRGAKVETGRIETFGLRESEVDSLLLPVRSIPGVAVGTLASNGCTSVVVAARGPEAQARIREALETAESILGPSVFGKDGETLEHAFVALLLDKGITIATAESCTGGLVGHLISSVPGVSAVYLEGIVAYSNASKISRLGVPPVLIGEKGAVSAEVAASMAEGAARSSGAALGVATTGIAGPDGGSPEKPVGTVFIAVRHGGETHVRRLSLGGLGRSWTQRISAMSALDLARRILIRNLDRKE